MSRTIYTGWFGFGLFIICFLWFAFLTTLEMIQTPIIEPKQKTYTYSPISKPPKKTKCFPGCEKVKILPGKYDTDQVETLRWQCSRKSMYEGGKDGGLCDNITECRDPNPTCCCYDFQCNTCENE